VLVKWRNFAAKIQTDKYMKAKIVFFCIALLGVVFVPTAHSSTSDCQTGKAEVSTIPLEDERPSGGRPRSITIPPITAQQQGNMLFVYFQRDIGVIEVTITDSRGSDVFTEMVDTNMQPSLVISLMGLPQGSYVITFNGSSVNLRGEFEM
jgi:hypothetical protein